MANITSIAVPQSDLAALKGRGINISKVCRDAIHRALVEDEEKSENVTGGTVAKPTPGNLMNQPSRIDPE